MELPDFAAIESLADGDVLRLSRGAVLRLRNETPLRFGDVAIPTGNLAPGFAGSYGLWLKPSGDGWRLVFNHEADSWGTQHDPTFDAAEIDVTYIPGRYRDASFRGRPPAGCGARRTARHSLGPPPSGRPTTRSRSDPVATDL